MTTGRTKKTIKYTRYQNGLEMPASFEIDDLSEFNGLLNALDAYDREYLQYFKKIAAQNKIDFDTQATQLEKLFITDSTHDALIKAREKLYEEAEALAQQSVRLREPRYFWFDAEPAALAKANNISDALKKVGTYVRNRISETPWHLQVDAKMYAMRELQTSPESFLQVNKPNNFAKVHGLNHHKGNFPNVKLNNVDTLTKQVNIYVEGVKKAVDTLNAEKVKLQGKIKKIEDKGKTGSVFGNFWNFCLGLFTGEKKKLDALKVQLRNVEIATQEPIEDIALIQNRCKFRFLSTSLLQNPEQFSVEDILPLHSTIDALSTDKKEEENIAAFVSRLQGNITDKIGAETSTQWMFLSERKKFNSNPLNKTAANASEVIRKKLLAIDNYNDGLIYINKLEEIGEETWKKFDAVLYNEIMKKKDELENIRQFHCLSLEFLDNPRNFSEKNMSELHTVIDALSGKNKQNITYFVATLQKSIIENIDQLSIVDDIAAVLSKQWMFLSKRKNDTSNSLNATVDAAKKVINDKLAAINNYEDGLAYIEKLEKIGENAWIAFDSTLYQNIQYIKQQFNSLKLIQTGWDSLLNDDKASAFSDKEIEVFIGAQLWLGTSNSNGRNDAQHLQIEAKAKIIDLEECIVLDLNDLTNVGIVPNKALALQNRLKFITQANTMYTKELGELRKSVIETIKTQLQSKLSVKEYYLYLTNLREVLPGELQNDPEILEIINTSKIDILKKHLDQEQTNLLEQFKAKLEFLVSSKRDVVDILFEDVGSQPEREDRLEFWRINFNEYIRQLRLYGFIDGLDKNDTEILTGLLDEMILADYGSISDLLQKDLRDLADIKQIKQKNETTIALKKIDDIFGCEKTQDAPVSINMFMLRFVAMAQCQRQFANSKSTTHLGAAGREAVRLFHHLMQDSGKFTTGIVAQLDLAELNAMYFTLGANPTIEFSNVNDAAPMHLKHDIVGRVDNDKNMEIEVPRYLLLKQVLELIIADLEAILRGETADKLEDRLNFALPKLEEHMKKEMDLNQNSEQLRQCLKDVIQKINLPDVNTQYSKLISDHVSENISSWDKSWGRLNNESECETVLLKQLKFELNDLMTTFSNVQAKDIKIDLTKEEDITALNMDIRQKIMLRDQSTDQEKVHLNQTIASLVAQRDNLLNPIANAQLKASCVEECRDFLVGETANKLRALIKNTNSLRELIYAVNPDIFTLFKDKSFAKTCMSLRQNIHLASLFEKDTTFKDTYTTILENLENLSVPVLDTVRMIPRSLTHEFEVITADMVHQLQYHFSNNFQQLILKLLNKSNIELLNETTKMKKTPHKNENEEKYSFFGNFNFTTLFHSQEKKEAQETTAKEHLKLVLEKMEPDLVKKLLAFLPAELGYLNEMLGKSAPIAIVARMN